MADRDIQIIIQAIDKTGSAIASINNNLSWLGGSITKVAVQFNAMSGSVQRVWAVIQKGLVLVEEAAKAQQAEETFRRVAASAGESADRILEAMQRAANGTIDNTDLMQKAAKGMLQGLKGDDLIRITAAARVGARTALVDVATAFDEIADAISNKAPKALMKFGAITREQIDIYNAALHAGVAGTSLLEIACLNLAIQEEKTGKMTTDISERMQQFKTDTKEAKQEFGNILSWGFNAWAISMGEIIALIDKYRAATKRASAGIADIFGADSRAEQLRKEADALDAAAKRYDSVFNKKSSRDDVHYSIGETPELKRNATLKKLEEDTEKSKLKDKLKALSDSWAQTKIGLESDISTSGLSDFVKKVGEIDKKADELKNKYGKISGAGKLIESWRGKEEENLVQASMKEGSKALADYERSLTEMQASELDKRLMQTDAWALKERELLNAARKGGAVDEDIYQKEISRIIAASEKEKSKIRLSAAKAGREAEIQGRLSEIAALEKTHVISEDSAIEQKITLNQELLVVQEEYQASLDKTKDPSSWYAQADAIAATRDRLIGLKESAKEYGTAWDGIIEGIRKYTQEQKKTFKAGEEMARQVTSGMESAFTSFFDTTSEKFMNFGELAKSILQSIYMAIVQNLIVKQLVAGIMGGVFHEGGVVMHQGGLVMHAGGYVVPRYHMGTLAADERPAILQTGEGVLSRRGMANLGALNAGTAGGGNLNVNVQIENQTGTPVKAEQSGVKFDGESYIVGVILKNIDGYGALRGAIAGIK